MLGHPWRKDVLRYLTGSTVPSCPSGPPCRCPAGFRRADAGVALPATADFVAPAGQGRLFDKLMRCDVAVFGTPRLLASQMILSPIQLG